MKPLCSIVFVVLSTAADASQPHPNILWITAEDMSPTLGCYGDDYATTPHIDMLCKQSVRYTQAFATAPVCSPARACLINGCMATTQGTHQMRSVLPIPNEMRGFPALLRESGYYTTNNVKTDYNSGNSDRIIDASWDENSETADWSKRESGQPFFCVFNLMTSHQSRTMVWPYEQFQDEVQSRLSEKEIHNPVTVPVPPYYPDTPLVRKTLARYYDCVTAMDREVGDILQKLADDGLADDTIVFFYSDHGSGMPRHKRALLDSGMKIPLLVRFPEKYSHLASGKPGDTNDRLVCFEDFGPTVLRIAGIDTKPEYMDGQSFIGAATDPPRQYVYGHRDRVDEIVDLARSVRDKRYLYIRNYMPHLGYNQQSSWIDQGEVRQDFYRLATSPNITPPQRHFIAPTRPIEELYDCQDDPMNLNNLANSADHQMVLARLRRAHHEWVRESRDLGFLPETEQWKIARRHVPYTWARSDGNYDIDAIVDAASLVGTESFEQFRENLRKDYPAIRYWAAVACSAATALPDDLLPTLTRALADPSEIVRIEAANALARHGRLSVALPALARLLEHDDLTVILYAARTIELLGAQAATLHGDMKSLFDRFENEPGDAAWFIRFTTTGFLDRVQPNRATVPTPVDTSKTIPSDAVVIFAGQNTDMLAAPNGGACNWPVEDGAIVCDPKGQSRQQGLWTRLHFRDAQIHVEFQVPAGDDKPGSGNSGLYLHGLFEQQIIDSHKRPMKPIGMTGSVYGIRPPAVNAARRPGAWQSYDIIFHAPRRNDEGEPVKAGSITTLLNGVLIQHHTGIARRVSTYTPLYFRTTPYAEQIRASLLKTECGPMQLQDHDSPVRFRNIWIRPLDDRAYTYATR